MYCLIVHTVPNELPASREGPYVLYTTVVHTAVRFCCTLLPFYSHELHYNTTPTQPLSQL
jgi:hypothetical protein